MAITVVPTTIAISSRANVAGLLIDPAHLGLLVGDGQVDQLLQVVVQVFLDLGEVPLSGGILAAARYDPRSSSEVPYICAGNRAHLLDQRRARAARPPARHRPAGRAISALVICSSAAKLASRSRRASSNSATPSSPNRSISAICSEYRLACSESCRDRLELTVRDRDPLNELVGASDREVDDGDRDQDEADEEHLKGDDLRADAQHGRDGLR